MNCTDAEADAARLMRELPEWERNRLIAEAGGKVADARQKLGAWSPPCGICAIFFREEMFYPVTFSGTKPPKEEAAEHAALNPGTLRVEDTWGNLLWEPDPEA